ncbi:lipoma-preferred partner homolog isoform X2 [Hyalella azteca]|uniref:Lipoma-preferred partner homolog isoform X2 n=1 Tax=Hyalella azteca TaxID=294128 RepID=A0A8B7PP32_HYAAZ|nr:lipoma-preferred partner homolog isoform X2 [Hyalella azteca]
MYGNSYGSINTSDRDRNMFNKVVDEIGGMTLNSGDTGAPQQSPGGGRVAPMPPPKPRKATENHSPMYANLSSAPSGRSALNDYYAINAPTPGNIGKVSARVNIAAMGPAAHAPAMHSLNGAPAGICDPLAPGKMGRSESRAYNPDATPPSHYTPPSPQPAHSYTPTSRAVVRMGAPQPLYSNTNKGGDPTPADGLQYDVQQPGLYSNIPDHQGDHYQAYPYANQQGYSSASSAQRGVPYASYGVDQDFPLPPPEALSECRGAASPVSSAYSELRRSSHEPPSNTHRSHPHYAPTSSVGYESLYEAISPRPPSQMSTRSAAPLAPYGANPGYGARNQPQSSAAGKEAEVDALTSLLVQSMESSSDPEFFGICGRCGGKVVGEGSGCTAMDQVFHIRCFDCIVCHLQLQGKPFYAVDSKPYCEQCYVNTLEKCCVCTQPILERILRATGKPYHPACFTCVVCHKALDGIPFTVDAANQIHCIDDFHKKFAPRCSVCQEPIMPEPGLEETVRVVALDRSFHVNCYKCEDCGLLLSSEAEGRGCYPLDGHVLCKACNAARIQALSNAA